MSLRGRYIKSEFWDDATIQTKLTFEQRLTYIGLWSYADDAAWLKWDVATIGAVLYRFEPRESREARVKVTLDALIKLRKARRFRCGHVHLTSMEKHLRHGRRQFSVRDEHLRKCLGSNPPDPIQRESKEIKGDSNPSLSLSNSHSTHLELTTPRARVRRQRTIEKVGESEEFQELMQRAGYSADRS